MTPVLRNDHAANLHATHTLACWSSVVCAALRAFEYERKRVVLHTDASLMPPRLEPAQHRRRPAPRRRVGDGVDEPDRPWAARRAGRRAPLPDVEPARGARGGDGEVRLQLRAARRHLRLGQGDAAAPGRPGARRAAADQRRPPRCSSPPPCASRQRQHGPHTRCSQRRGCCARQERDVVRSAYAALRCHNILAHILAHSPWSVNPKNIVKLRWRASHHMHQPRPPSGCPCGFWYIHSHHIFVYFTLGVLRRERTDEEQSVPKFGTLFALLRRHAQAHTITTCQSHLCAHLLLCLFHFSLGEPKPIAHMLAPFCFFFFSRRSRALSSCSTSTRAPANMAASISTSLRLR